MALELNGTTGVSLVQDGVVTAADLADGAVTAGKLNSTLDLSSKTLTMPAANNAMTLLITGSVPSSVSNVDFDLSSYVSTYKTFKFFFRDFGLSSNASIEMRKMTASNTTINALNYGGGSWQGEGANSSGEYTNAASYYLLGDTNLISDTGLYKGGWEITIAVNENNMMSFRGVGLHRQNTGSTSIRSGALQIDTNPLWGVRLLSSGTIDTLKYSVYGVNAE